MSLVQPIFPLPCAGLPVLPTPITAEAEKDHYTRLNILTRVNAFCLPDKSCQLAEHAANRSPQDELTKVLSVVQFLALSLVREKSCDVVAVCLDEYPDGRAVVSTTRNSTSDADFKQAAALKDLFDRIFIAAKGVEPPESKDEKFIEFRDGYLKLVLSWGRDKVVSRMNAIYGGGGDGAISKARMEKALHLRQVIQMIQEIRTDAARMARVREIQAKYKVTEKAVSAVTGNTTLLRGDIQILQRAFASKRTIVDIIAAWLDFILSAIKNFYKAISKADNFKKQQNENPNFKDK